MKDEKKKYITVEAHTSRGRTLGEPEIEGPPAPKCLGPPRVCGKCRGRSIVAHFDELSYGKRKLDGWECLNCGRIFYKEEGDDNNPETTKKYREETG